MIIHNEMEFIIDKESKTITIKKEFDAELSKVWNAWTKSEILDIWWAPKPYITKTISMNFAQGGFWFYAMVSPEGDKHYCKAYYKKIDKHKMFSHKDAFCDEQGVDNPEMPSTNWLTSFESIGNKTIVNIFMNFETEEQLETLIKMGFKEGFTAATINLDEFFLRA